MSGLKFEGDNDCRPRKVLSKGPFMESTDNVFFDTFGTKYLQMAYYRDFTRVAVLFFCTILISGCSLLDTGDDGEVSLTTTKASYESGEAVAATLSNRTSDSISFGACVESVNGLVDGQWVSVYKPEACIDIAYFLESGNDFGLVLPKIAYPLADQYRIEFLISTGTGTEIIESNTFTISAI